MRTSTPVRSPSPRVPNVFVIPPEEEQPDNPPWCCFDADELSDDDSESVYPSEPDDDAPLSDLPFSFDPHPEPDPSALDTLIFRVGTIDDEVTPKIYLSRKLEKKQRPDMLRIVERDDTAGPHRALDDSDVIEVVKVKRSKDVPRDSPVPVRANTLRARATKAFQSIRNVGRSSRKRHVKDLWTSSESVPGAFEGMQEQIRQQQEQLQPSPPPPSVQPSPPRSSSRPLSHILLAAKSSPPRRFSFDPTPPATLRSMSARDTALSASDALDSCRPSSPSPSLKKNHKRFSIKELHKVFTFSSSLSELPPLPPSPTTPPPPPSNTSAPSASTSTVSSEYPDVPPDGAYAAVHLFDFDHANQKFTLPASPQVTDDDDDYGVPLSRHERHERHMSVEMRLDSFHFDSLSFDPEHFDVSMSGFR